MTYFSRNNISEMNHIIKLLYNIENTKKNKPTKNKAENHKKKEREKNHIATLEKTNLTNSDDSFLLPDTVGIGTRHDILFRYGCSLRGKNLPESDIELLITNFNQNKCHPPLEQDELIENILPSVLGYPSGKKPSKDIGIKISKGKGKEYVFLTDSETIANALDKCGFQYFQIKADTNIIISHNKDKVIYVPCGSSNFIYFTNQKLDALKAIYSRIIWLAFIDNKLLVPGKDAILFAVIHELIEIEKSDPSAFVFEDIILYSKNNSYYIKTSRNCRCISNFTIKIIKQLDIKNDIGNTISSEYEMEFYLNSGKVITKRVHSSVFATTRQFKNWLKSDSILLSYFGSDNELELIQLKIQEEACSVPVHTGIDHTGIYFHKNRYVYVGMDKSIYGDGTICTDVIAVLDDNGSVSSNILMKKCISKNDMESLLKSLFEFNTHNNTIPVVAWGIASFFKERFRKVGWKFPHLLIIGEAGSGKSSACENFLMPLHSITSDPLSCDKLTNFASLKAFSSSSLTPTLLEEFKPSRIGSYRVNQISGILRDVFDGHEVRRGLSTLQVRTFKYRSPCCVVGEASTEEKAIKDRTIETTFSLNYRTKEHTENYFILKKNSEWLEDLGYSMLLKSLNMDDEQVIEMLEECLDYFQKTTSFTSRNQLGLACMLFGIRVLKQICSEMNIDFVALTGIDGTETIQALVGNITTSLGDGSGSQARTEVEKILEVMSTMLQKNMINGQHVQINASKNEVCLALQDLYNLFYKHFHEYQLQNDIDLLNKNSFSKQLRLSPYFIKY